jgi:hypothetical protein
MPAELLSEFWTAAWIGLGIYLVPLLAIAVIVHALF